LRLTFSRIAIGGTIGTGLFLGTGKSLAEGGPASMLICYTLVGAIVYVTLLLLGEMATQYPVAGALLSSFLIFLLERATDGRLLGSFTTYAARFVSPSYAGSLAYNYWLNDAVSLAGDLVAAQLVVRFWLDTGSWAEQHAWILSLVFWTGLVGVNAASVRAYGEMGTWDPTRAGAHDNRNLPRVLALVSESDHDRSLHPGRHSGECWLEPGTHCRWL
jgi:amino acid transporter, AAT family